MRTVELVAYRRTDIGTATSKRLRAEGLVPGVLYGGNEENVHFSVPMILFRELLYTPEAAFVNLDVEGTEYKCVLQSAQFHPVSEVILHADFLRLYDDKPVRMDIPVKFVGKSEGLQKGGKLAIKMRKLKVEALPKDMPDEIEVSLDGLDLGQSVKVGSVKQDGFRILNNNNVTVGSITIPRALRSAQAKAKD